MKSFDVIKTINQTETLCKYLDAFVLSKDLLFAELKIVIYANNNIKVLL